MSNQAIHEQIQEKETAVLALEHELDSLTDALTDNALLLYDNIGAFYEARAKADKFTTKAGAKLFYKITGRYDDAESKIKNQCDSAKQAYDECRKPVSEIQEKIRVTKNTLAAETNELKKLKEQAGNTETGGKEKNIKEKKDMRTTELRAKEKELTDLIDTGKRAGSIALEIMQKMEAVNEYTARQASKKSSDAKLTVTPKNKIGYEALFDKKDAAQNIDDIYSSMSDVSYILKSFISKMSATNKNLSAYPKISDNGVTIAFIDYFYSILCTSIRDKEYLTDDHSMIEDINEKLGKVINEAVDIRAKITQALKSASG